jgi:acyl-CoA synthetase (AMP-forming)/AMP-acid ligase II
VSTIPELVRRAGKTFADRVAVVDGPRQATFRDVDARSIRLANAVRGLAPSEGSRVAILMRNRLEYIEADIAIARAGMVKVPINPRLSDDERRYLVEDSGASVLVTEREELDRVAAVLGDTDVVLVSVGGGTGTVDYDDVLTGASGVEAPIGPDPERLSLLLYTSGTTGRPKGAMLLDRCRMAGTVMMLAEEYPVKPDDGMIHAGPLSHGSGSKVLTFYLHGARNIVMPKFDPEAFVRCVQQDGGTTSFMVPTMIQMLLDLHRETGASGAWGLRNISYGGASISRETMSAALDAFGTILTQVYGSCEAPHPVTVLRHRDEPDPYVSGHQIVPAGRETIGVDIRLVDSEGNDATDDVGEMWVRGANVMAGYWNKADATAESLVDGWYRTGDVARRSDDGMLSIVDRSKDIIITGGLNVYPAEVERVLRDLAGVKDVAVVGLPDDRWGEIVAVAIVADPTDDLDQPAVEEWCASRLANYKKPRHVSFVDDLPKGSTGKVIKRGVRDLLLEGPE